MQPFSPDKLNPIPVTATDSEQNKFLNELAVTTSRNFSRLTDTVNSAFSTGQLSLVPKPIDLTSSAPVNLTRNGLHRVIPSTGSYGVSYISLPSYPPSVAGSKLGFWLDSTGNASSSSLVLLSGEARVAAIPFSRAAPRAFQDTQLGNYAEVLWTGYSWMATAGAIKVQSVPVQACSSNYTNGSTGTWLGDFFYWPNASATYRAGIVRIPEGWIGTTITVTIDSISLTADSPNTTHFNVYTEWLSSSSTTTFAGTKIGNLDVLADNHPQSATCQIVPTSTFDSTAVVYVERDGNYDSYNGGTVDLGTTISFEVA